MIAAERLTKYYGDKCAISDLTFQISRGEIIGILGLNGAGKTTTLRILACLLLPSSGKVSINGIDIDENPHGIRKQVGFLPEEPPLYRDMTVGSFLLFSAELRGLGRADARARLEKVLDLTHTREVRDELIGNLSHGYRKRVGIGQAIIHQPPVLILDEPISGLDPVQIVEMREMIRALKGSHTILVSSHILPEISQTCDRIFVINEGRMIAAGTEEELSGVKHLMVLVRGDRERAVQVVRALEGVSACHVTAAPGQPEQSEIHQLRIEAQQDIRETLSRELVQAGLGLLQLTSEGKLESIFLELTQSHKEAAQ